MQTAILIVRPITKESCTVAFINIYVIDLCLLLDICFRRERLVDRSTAEQGGTISAQLCTENVKDLNQNRLFLVYTNMIGSNDVQLKFDVLFYPTLT